jgi:UDP-N-acetylmuramoyl-tripeptide--D-alanyl-D-alanine ligase
MNVKIVNKSAFDTPEYATVLSAGMDLKANITDPVTLKPLERTMIPTGLYIELPAGYEAQIRPRSGLAAKSGITVANSPGTIDADYRGEIKVILINLSRERFKINKGDRIAQMIVSKHEHIEWKEVKELGVTERGEGGFGSTGVGLSEIIVKLHELFMNSSGGVCTDTRKIIKDSLFFALRGETFDGNEFAVKALESGASYSIVDDKHIIEKNVIYSERLILVPNVLEALQQLARYHRLQYHIPVIGLTGTNGKTTTKELITSVLRKRYNVVATEGNFNNHIGVPLSLLKINSQTQAAVIEMGASAPGEIKTLVNIVCPVFGLITNVGKAHLLGFGSFEGVKKTKGELYDNLLEHKRIAFVNIDNPILSEMISQRPDLHIVPYGAKNDGAKIVVNQKDNPFLKLIIPNPFYGNTETEKQLEIQTKLIGIYNADNVLAALCIGTYFNVPLDKSVEAVCEYTPTNNRSQMVKTERNTLIIDAYNANPTSMRASLENFKSLNFQNKILILGDMLELGTDSVEEHRKILEFAISFTPEHIYLAGNEFAKAYELLKDSYTHQYSTSESNPAGKNAAAIYAISLYENVNLLSKELETKQLSGKTILIKGSHGIHLERLTEAGLL